MASLPSQLAPESPHLCLIVLELQWSTMPTQPYVVSVDLNSSPSTCTVDAIPTDPWSHLRSLSLGEWKSQSFHLATHLTCLYRLFCPHLQVEAHLWVSGLFRFSGLLAEKARFLTRVCKSSPPWAEPLHLEFYRCSC